ncbi:hypothetical protein BDV59DRAFT_202815 [Aspergillus ambiguus]|uniref:uncharacterized protein n=1 Tax=Aspergillus ambiguus TaxID=176160 RepID=UPI003CCCEAAB
MRLSSVLVPALGALATAQSTTVVSIFEAFAENPYLTVSTYTSLAGSVMGINAEATTYQVACMDGAAKSECSIDQPYTVIAGPTTVSFSQTIPIDVYGATATATQDVACSFTHSSESAKCTITAGVASGDISTTVSSTKSFATDEVFYNPVTVTGGLSLFNSPKATEVPDAAAGPNRPLVTAAPLGAAVALAAGAFL